VNHPVIKQMKARTDFIHWYQYKNIFLHEKRIKAGAHYWFANRDWMDKAKRQYGVPPSIITAALGVETFYGKEQGSFPVFDSLAVLGFDYSPRARFFRFQLQDFLLYARRNNINPLSVKGSYAGAIGQPQFMPSSIKPYAINFTGIGKINLSTSDADAIGSIANYYHDHGWVPGAPVATPIRITNKKLARKVLEQKQINWAPISAYAKYGIVPKFPVKGDPRATIITLQEQYGPTYWFIFHNFVVIKRYNDSNDYAMALYQLSLYIRNEYYKEINEKLKQEREAYMKNLALKNKQQHKVHYEEARRVN
jgi:membrane-bound lytic murein transglycosylase B